MDGSWRGQPGLGPVPSVEDFQATADPALIEAADRTAEVKLLAYEELYMLWERQQWPTQELDFTRDREDWHERITEEERFTRMYGLSSFFIGEQKVTEELGPIMRAAPTEEKRIFLCTQIADEARHVRFFNRFYARSACLASDDLSRDAGASEHLNENFEQLFDEMLKERVDRLATEPETPRPWSRPSRSTTWSSRECWPSPGSTSSSTTTKSRGLCRPS